MMVVQNHYFVAVLSMPSSTEDLIPICFTDPILLVIFNTIILLKKKKKKKKKTLSPL